MVLAGVCGGWKCLVAVGVGGCSGWGVIFCGGGSSNVVPT